MKRIENRKAQGLEKPFPGCMGRMVNLFDLSAGMTENRLLTEKAHRDGSLFPRSRADAAMLLDPSRDQEEDKPIGYEYRRTLSNKKSNATPMKMLIAQEMSKEMESKHKPPSVVAKLMGLDALPGQQYDPTAQRSQPKGNSRITQPGMLLRCRQQENGFLDKQMQCEIHPFQEQNEYKDVYEVWRQSPKTNYVKDKSPQKGRYNGSPDERKMALVRQKFIEAKSLATDERLRQSKEFQDALEVLSSNKDLFLKFLQEPNSLFSQHLYELQSIPPPPQTRRITVLKPSKIVENNRFTEPGKTEKQIKKHTQVVEVNAWNKNKSGWSPLSTNQKPDNSAQPTRIVVLKPSPGKTHDIKAMVSSPPLSPRLLHGRDFYVEAEDDVAQGSREVAKEITQQMRESLSSNQRDETMLSSMFSNGYVGDESSFNRSDNEYVEEGNLSDSEVMTPTSRHSWDYINRLGSSPYSSSPFSRASYSPESSVCREAKKRLSERWAMMASNGSGQEQRQVRRSSSTLGEMLSLSDTKKPVRSGEEGNDAARSVFSSRSCGGEQDLRGEASCLSSSRNEDECEEVSPRNLLRSRSVPVSSTAYGSRLNVEVPDPEVDKSFVHKEMTKSKSGKSSFKGKVSRLFFSRNKKPSKEESSASLASSKDGSLSVIAKMSEVPGMPSTGKISDDIPQCVTESGLEGGPSTNNIRRSSIKTSPAFICVGPKQGNSREEIPPLAKPEIRGNPCENQDQPSPNSVLEAPFEEDINTIVQFPGDAKSDHQGSHFHLHPLKSNLIDKSPPIESIARTLLWNDSSSETATPVPLNSYIVPTRAEEEEQEQLLFVQMLLSAAGLDCEEQSDAIYARWHSLENPLDPSLIDKCVDMKEDRQLNEANRRHRRSDRRLTFDCVNAALVDIMGYKSGMSPWTRVSGKAQNRSSVGAPIHVDEVWGRVKELFSSEAKCFSGETGNSSLVVERVVRQEVVGKGWVELMRLEVDGIGKEIEGEMLEELVEETLIELTGGL